MLIACLGWGSLIWDTRELPVRGAWFTDGPFLPVEFARQSSDGRITLVLMPSSSPLLRSLWQPVAARNVADARKTLGLRECQGLAEPKSCIDYWPRGTRNRFVERQVGQWARRLQIDAVVWTNLCPRFQGKNMSIPSEHDIVTYLQGLRGSVRTKARRYIQMTPKQIDTDYRRAIKQALGWSCLSQI